MKSAGTIRMEYQATLRKAASLEDLAGELRSIAREIDNQRGAVSSSWTGDAAAEYLKKLAREKDLVTRRARQLEQAASGVRSAAQRLYNVEMYALSLLNRH